MKQVLKVYASRLAIGIHLCHERISQVKSHPIASFILLVVAAFVFVDEWMPHSPLIEYLHHYGAVYLAGLKLFDALKNVIIEGIEKLGGFVRKKVPHLHHRPHET